MAKRKSGSKIEKEIDEHLKDKDSRNLRKKLNKVENEFLKKEKG